MSHIPESAMPHAKAPHPKAETTTERVKKAASAESLAWMYRYHVDWDEPVPQAA